MALDEGDKLNMIALIVALVALFASLGQLLQAMFGTADGYRKCQWSVIGPWAKLTRLKWRWREFRFETKFTTPVIGLSWDASMDQNKYIELTGPNLREQGGIDILSRESGVLDTVDLLHRSQASPELLSWVRLLAAIWSRQAPYYAYAQFSERAYGRIIGAGDRASLHVLLPTFATSVPREVRCAIKMVERSWDLVPSEVAVPVASTTVRDIVVIAHRLGMEWQSLDPFGGSMVAQGSGHLLSATTVRGLGLTLSYFCKDSDADILRRIGDDYIPSREVDKLHCGILAEERHRAEWIASDGTPVGLYDLLRSQHLLDLFPDTMGGPASQTFGSFEGDNRLYHCALNEFVALRLPFLPLHPPLAKRIPWPLPMDETVSMFQDGANQYAILYRLDRLHRHCRCLSADSGSKPPYNALHRVWEISRTLQCAHSAFRDLPHCSDDHNFTGLREIHRETTEYFHQVDNYTTMNMHVWTWTARSLRLSKATRDAFRDGRARGPLILLYEPATSPEDGNRVMAEVDGVLEELSATHRLQETMYYHHERAIERQDPEERQALFLSELVHQHFDDLENTYSFHDGWAPLNPEVEGWLYLLVRGMSWWLSVDITPQKKVIPSSNYYNSLPVYLI